MDMSEIDEEEGRSKCSVCLYGCRKLTTFFLSHVGLISLVVGYCIMGAFTFEALESAHELEVKKNMSDIRKSVTKDLWVLTKNTHVIIPSEWIQNASTRLQEFETELLRAMKKGGWDGSESNSTQQWTFSGALFYSIVVITTIGYGHIAPKTVWGKVVTIFYAILGIPLMLLCLSHIGDFMAKAFRFLYWKVCCYMCTRRPRALRRHQSAAFRRGRSMRVVPSRQYGSAKMSKRSAAIRRSARTSQRSADSAFSDSALFGGADLGIRRIHSDHNMKKGDDAQGGISSDVSPTDFRRYGNAERQLSARSTRSAEPSFDYKDPEILCNRYVGEQVICTEPESYKFVRRLRPPEQFAYADYWEDDAEDYYESEEELRKRPVPIWLCVLLVLSYILFGAFLFSGWERWNFLDSAYFCFVTLTTIGFGDFVPAQRVKNESSEMSIALCSLYLLFGISLLAMSFNLVQEEVISNVKLVATRLGIIRDEDD